MAPLHRVLVALSMILLLTGAARLATSRSAKPGPPAVGPTAAASTNTSRPSATAPPTAAGAPGPATAALEGGLITPTDMGGYYRTTPAAGTALLASAPCLAPLGPARAESGHAVTALLGPDQHSVPTVVEVVSSYPGASSRGHYAAAVAALDACVPLAFDFAGTEQAARLASSSIAPVADADHVWSGSFKAGAGTFTIQLGVILDADEVLTLLWIDSVPASDPIMGSFTSTVSLAIGKLA